MTDLRASLVAKYLQTGPNFACPTTSPNRGDTGWSAPHSEYFYPSAVYFHRRTVVGATVVCYRKDLTQADIAGSESFRLSFESIVR